MISVLGLVFIPARLSLPEWGFSFPMPERNIILVAKREDPFARVPKITLADPRLSWRAKGILSYLLGKPVGWKVRTTDLQNKSNDGSFAIRSALSELRKAGYAKLERSIGEKGKVAEWTWKISDSPIFSPDSGFPHVGKPLVGKRHISKNHCTKPDCTKNKSEEAKETSPADDVFISPVWKPDQRTKEQQRRQHQNALSFPSQVEFNDFAESEAPFVASHRSDLYGQLCRNKWRLWNEENNQWEQIIDWRAVVIHLNAKMGSGCF